MRVRINKINSDWFIEAILFKETDEKIFVYSNNKKMVEFHFPKHSYYYKKMEPDD
tara:strand:- start:130 stop:294 length:165 start_codon:yes stop_codon:yes gene_type:complete